MSFHAPGSETARATRATAVAGLLALAAVVPADAARERLDLRYIPLMLPGAPAAVVSADLDGDGVRDLAVVATGTQWGEISMTESVSMDDIEGLVEVLTIVPSLQEERELRVYPGRAGGGFGPGSLALKLERSVLTIDAGPPGAPILALTDDGIAALRLRPRADAPVEADAFSGGELAWEALVADRPVIAGTGTFLPNLGLVKDVDGDGASDVLLPTPEGLAVYLATATGLAPTAASRVSYPEAAFGDRPADRGSSGIVRRHPLPELRDVDGDRLPDLLLLPVREGLRGLRVLRNLGGGRFGDPVLPLGEAPDDDEDAESGPPGAEPAWFGDVDGDGRAEVVTVDEKETSEDAGMREELNAAKRPHFLYAFHHTRADLTAEPKPYREMEVEGYGVVDVDTDDEFVMPGGFIDLSGDGRSDLVAITLDFSLAQVVKIMAVRRVTLGLDFHVWCQRADGSYRAVPGLDLSGKFNIDLDDLAIRQLSQFSGDFDGDGRSEFVQIGRGKTVTIHRGSAECAYPARADLSVELEEEPRDLSLVQIRDLDGDGLADLMVTQPQPRKAGDATTSPVRLDLYLSGGVASNVSATPSASVTGGAR